MNSTAQVAAIFLKHLIPALEQIYMELEGVPEEDDLLTAAQAAKLLNVDRSWIYNRKGRIKCIRLGGLVRIPMSEVKRLKEAS
jgi:excisionase family DNA binding protein